MSISVVIPTLDEATQIVGAVESALDRRSAADGADGVIGVDVLVVDGGSRDATCQLAREAGARVLELAEACPDAKGARPPGRGRAHQLRLGSERTEGETLLFLHADTRLPTGWPRAVAAAMAEPGCAGGAFTFRFAERGGWERWIEWWVGRRVSVFGLPYGDQALFVRRSVLEQMGGIAIVPIMEDLDLVRGIKRAGRLAVLAEPATTSSRRYRSRGPLRTVFWHAVALGGFFLGVDRAKLAARMGR
ncbi:MAG: TIGR04283 family arsenosugar biosynthesis glycosyltransferase [bacterium]|nr:TIGR04283 family arsenosugar biosynthesis glycosyltransferase [bacterium]